MNPLSQLISAAWLLRDWLGAGGLPVAKELAESRSLVCATGGTDGKLCPNNVEPNWWERVLNKIALTIRRQLALKHKMGLFVSKENDLSMCRACGCALRLKVHVPIEHIKDHTTDEQLGKMPDFCWIKKEIGIAK